MVDIQSTEALVLHDIIKKAKKSIEILRLELKVLEKGKLNELLYQALQKSQSLKEGSLTPIQLPQEFSSLLSVAPELSELVVFDGVSSTVHLNSLNKSLDSSETFYYSDLNVENRREVKSEQTRRQLVTESLNIPTVIPGVVAQSSASATSTDVDEVSVLPPRHAVLDGRSTSKSRVSTSMDNLVASQKSIPNVGKVSTPMAFSKEVNISNADDSASSPKVARTGRKPKSALLPSLTIPSTPLASRGASVVDSSRIDGGSGHESPFSASDSVNIDHSSEMDVRQMNFDVAMQQWSEERMTELLNLLKKHYTHAIFDNPVTDQEAPGYSTIITDPMDYSTLTSLLQAHKLPDLESFSAQVEKIIRNCMTYNAPAPVPEEVTAGKRPRKKQDGGYYGYAEALGAYFRPLYQKALLQREEERVRLSLRIFGKQKAFSGQKEAKNESKESKESGDELSSPKPSKKSKLMPTSAVPFASPLAAITTSSSHQEDLTDVPPPTKKKKVAPAASTAGTSVEIPSTPVSEMNPPAASAGSGFDMGGGSHRSRKPSARVQESETVTGSVRKKK